LVKHTYQSHWYLPGGGVNKGETIEEAARREADEELGAELGDLHLVGVYTNFYENKDDHVIVFSCDAFTLTGQTDHEIERFDFFRIDDLPDNVSPGSLKRIQEYTDGNGLPTVGQW
jgi:8-oxo-dGTP pyrophosphatase MutT (NUDIX family)